MKKYKVSIWAFIFSIILFVFGNITIDLYRESKIEKKINDITSEGNQVASSISEYINTGISISKTLAYVISQNEGLDETVDLVEDIIKSYGEHYTIEVANNERIKYVYPSTSNSRMSLNRSINDDKALFRWENNNYNFNKDTIISENIVLFSGEKGVIVRTPIYIKEANKNTLWGVVNCIIKEEELKKHIKKEFNEKYEYEIYYTDTVNKNKSIIFSNTKDPINHPKNIKINFEGDYWILSIDRKIIEKNVTFISASRIGVTLISVIAYFIFYLLMKYPILLKEQVKEIKFANYNAKKSEEKYRRFFDMSPDYIFVIDINKTSIVEANNTFVNLIGLDKFKNGNIKKLLVDSDQFIKNIIEKKNLKEIEIKIIGENNENIDVEINATVLSKNNFPLNILCVGRDLSERRRIEKIEKEKREKEALLREAIEYDKIKTEFFANMSHELRTPLNVILGSLQLIELTNKKNGDLKKVVDKNSHIIKQNSYRLLRIISNIIDITKFEANYLYLDLSVVNIVSIIEEITLSIVDYANSKEIEIEFDTDIEEVYIKCDAEKIDRVILNLLSNALKFTKPKDKIYVSILNFEDNIRICIKDTGIGIPKENIESIFERFRQVNKSFIREHEGSGIGLSLVKSLVEMHGGKIWAESIYGEGSEFYVDIPKNYFKLDAEEECAADIMVNTKHNLVEKISIEFSDIYFNQRI